MNMGEGHGGNEGRHDRKGDVMMTMMMAENMKLKMMLKEQTGSVVMKVSTES